MHRFHREPWQLGKNDTNAKDNEKYNFDAWFNKNSETKNKLEYTVITIVLKNGKRNKAI